MITISFRSPLTPDAAAYLTAHTGIDFGLQDMRHWFCATAYDERDEIVGVLTVEPKTSFDWYFSCAVTDPRVLSRRLLRTIFRTVFSHAVRITAEVDPANEHAARSARRLGFVYEGFKRRGLDGTRDALQFGMLPEDCRYLPGFHPAFTSIRPPSFGGHDGFLAQAS